MYFIYNNNLRKKDYVAIGNSHGHNGNDTCNFCDCHTESCFEGNTQPNKSNQEEWHSFQWSCWNGNGNNNDEYPLKKFDFVYHHTNAEIAITVVTINAYQYLLVFIKYQKTEEILIFNKENSEEAIKDINHNNINTLDQKRIKINFNIHYQRANKEYINVFQNNDNNQNKNIVNTNITIWDQII